MMDAAEQALRARGMAQERIRIERFASPDAPPRSSATTAQTAGPEAHAQPSARVTVVIDGKSRLIQVPFTGASLLDTGLAAGISLPYACKAGVCCTCRARVLEGEVKMDRHYTLERHELDAGFVLTCQSHPLTDEVRVSYDER